MFTITNLLLVIILTLVAYMHVVRRRNKSMPPGPPCFPVVGSLPYLGLNAQRSFRDLAARYGPVLYLKIGSCWTVVLNNYATVEEVIFYCCCCARACEWLTRQAGEQMFLCFRESSDISASPQHVYFAKGGCRQSGAGRNVSHLFLSSCRRSLSSRPSSAGASTTSSPICSPTTAAASST